MNTRLTKDRRALEIMLIVVILGMTFLMFRLGGYKMVVLNLFFLPVVLSGYYLGRASAGVLALFSALAVAIATTLDSSGFAAFNTPEMAALALILWAAVLGLTAILMGTLCDERAVTIDELHEAYVGVVEVLTTYLHCADPNVKARTVRIAELSQAVAEEMRLPVKAIDDLRVGALLHDLGNVEITTHVITKAMDTLQAKSTDSRKHTFQGLDLVQSLGSVLHGAVPLLLTQDDAVRECLAAEAGQPEGEIPTGAKILRAVRAYEAMNAGDSATPTPSLDEALAELRKDPSGEHDPEVLSALARAVRRPSPRTPRERALAGAV